MSISELFLKLVAPHECVGCRREGALLCRGCLTTLPPIPSRCYRCTQATVDSRTCDSCQSQSSLFQVWAVVDYAGTAKRLIHALKFERSRAGAAEIAHALSALLPHNQDWLIVHAPTATDRARVRGYDQAALIAKQTAKLIRSTYSPVLGRHGQDRQVGHGRSQRQQQATGTFWVARPELVQNRHILLIDDVLTTGATLEAAATVLRAAGASRVSAAVFAAA